MSRLLLIIGLLVSLALHALLLMVPAPATPQTPRVEIVPVLENVVASVEPVEEPVLEPAPQPAPEPAPEPAPKPAPQEPEPPQPAPPPEPRHIPAPDLVETAAAPRAEPSEPGDLAGTSEGRARPTLRIDWGSAARARATLDAGDMRVVVLRGRPPELIIDEELRPSGSAWERTTYVPAAAAARYSNHLRIVDDVPAFRELRRSARLGAEERLAVLLPAEVERRLQTAQIEAAFERGLTMDRIRDFAGLFSLEGDGLGFEITHVEEAP